ncbi:MAG: cupredoxin domain-containing protein [Candidatus Bipolaricaulota bacterium]|nr:cupredoxin domain-containing protein [Candidatus Bipolaricaulota bacterium]
MQYVWIILAVAIVVLGAILVLSEQPTAPISQQVKITLVEWRITPNPIELVAGQARLVVFNMGTQPHALAIMAMDRKVLRELEAVPAGQVQTFLIELPKGEFLLYDSLNCRDPIRGACQRKTMVSRIIVR